MTPQPPRHPPIPVTVQPPTPGVEPAPPSTPEHLPDGVEVAGLGRTGLAIAALLLEAGVGPLSLWDPSPVGPEDLGTGYLPADLGRPRAVAAERRLRDLRPHARIFAHLGAEPLLLGSATIAVCADRIDEGLVTRALAAEHPLLPVVVREGAVIGPWTVAGLPGCALCLHVHGPAQDHRRDLALAAADGWGAPPPPGPAAVEMHREPVVGAMRAAVLVHDVLLGGAGDQVWQASVRTWAWGIDETWGDVRPRHGCPCDPDGLAAGLAELAGELGPEVSRRYGLWPFDAAGPAAGPEGGAGDQDGEGPWSSSMTTSP